MSSNNSFILRVSHILEGIWFGLFIINSSSTVDAVFAIGCLCVGIIQTLFYQGVATQRLLIASNLVLLHYILKSFNESYMAWIKSPSFDYTQKAAWALAVITIMIETKFAVQKKR